MAGHGRGTKHKHYSNLPQAEDDEAGSAGGDQEEQELIGIDPHHRPVERSRSGRRHHDEDKTDTAYRGASRRTRPAEDVDYRAAQRDFRKHYGRDAPPVWRATEEGSGGLQTEYQSMGPGAQGQLARRHRHGRQYMHLLGKVLLRWFASFALAVAMVIAFYQYEKVKVLDTKARRWFNAVSTGLYLTLGLNLAASLKGMAIIVRWKLLARKRHQLEEIDFLLGLGSLIKVFRYGFHILRIRPLTAMACFGWIMFNAVGRLSVALTGLTYSYDSAGATLLHPGLVNITNWATFSERDAISRSYEPTPEAERLSAHAYGLFSVALQNQPVTTPGESDPNFPLDQPIEFRPDGSWVYYFREFNPQPKLYHGTLAHKSDRYVNVTARCKYYPIVEGQHGNQSAIAYLNGTERHELDTIFDFGPLATTWVNPRSDLPRNSGWSCGPRCAAVAALTFLSPTDTGPGAFYDCTVRVSSVENATHPSQELPDHVAYLAAGAIGLEGYSLGPDQWEYVRYAPESPWSNYGVGNNLSEDAEYMARLASRFAVGAIATKDLYGINSAQAPGQMALVGVLLKIKWKFLLLILGTILTAQLLLGCVVVTYANTVFCKDDSYLSTARLLRPVVGRLGPSGCALTGKDIAHTLQTAMVYGIRSDESRMRHHLDLGEDIKEAGTFPEGWYDGEVWGDVLEGEGEGVDVGRGVAGEFEVGRGQMGVLRRRRRRRKVLFGARV